MTRAVDDCSPDDDVLVEDEDDVAVVAVVAAAVLEVPGIVCALIAPSTPTPTSAVTAAPVVSRWRRRIAASRARTLSWIVSPVSMV